MGERPRLEAPSQHVSGECVSIDAWGRVPECYGLGGTGGQCIGDQWDLWSAPSAGAASRDGKPLIQGGRRPESSLRWGQRGVGLASQSCRIKLTAETPRSSLRLIRLVVVWTGPGDLAMMGHTALNEVPGIDVLEYLVEDAVQRLAGGKVGGGWGGGGEARFLEIRALAGMSHGDYRYERLRREIIARPGRRLTPLAFCLAVFTALG